MFGATDAPLSGEELTKSELVQFPMVMGGIVPVINLPGVAPGSITLDGPTLAKIFLGQIKSWDDAAIKALNPNAKLPRQAIVVVHRSEVREPPSTSLITFPKSAPTGRARSARQRRSNGRSGSAPKAMKACPITSPRPRNHGYVEYAYAKQNKLNFTKMINRDGKPVAPVSESFQAAAANADWHSVPGYGVVLSNQAGVASWPMTAATFILIPRQPKDAATAREALKFFDWAFTNGAKMAEDLDYVPMPAAVVRSTVRKTGPKT